MLALQFSSFSTLRESNLLTIPSSYSVLLFYSGLCIMSIQFKRLCTSHVPKDIQDIVHRLAMYTV